jgi:crotonobetainyl-CoA:carnitine CoA-transferase CaiB-like acyl-CoA transferase
MVPANQGAEGAKVEPVGGELFDHPVNAVINRGKRLLKRDLKDTVRRVAIADLIAGADVVMQSAHSIAFTGRETG